MTKSFGKHEQLYSFAEKAADPEALKSNLENWLSHVTVENEEILKKLENISMAFLKRKKNGISLPLKPLRKSSLLLRLPKRPLPEFLRHLASDNGNFS